MKISLMKLAGLEDPLAHPERLEFLSRERQKKIKELKNEKGRKQSLGAGLLLFYACLEYQGLTLEEFEKKSPGERKEILSGLYEGMTVGEHGKPEISGMHFSLSHAGDYALCAVSTAQVGADIEQIQTRKSGIAKRFFSEEENRWLAAGQTETSRFTRLWTLKESYVKYTGSGMTVPLDSFSIIPGDRGTGEDTVLFLGKEKQEGIFFTEFWKEDYHISVCGEEKDLLCIPLDLCHSAL